jgi:probable H4MPT-linked C1 transfer pathway protein
MGDFFGWDIGGVHLKWAELTTAPRPATIRTRVVPFEIWKDPGGLGSRLRSLLDGRSGPHALTMTAELSDVFPTRAEGVRTILRASAEALPGPPRVLDLNGAFVSVQEALERPLDVAAANWMATARLAGRARQDALLIDAGSTTTDIVPIRAGAPRPSGRTDTERLLSGELVYTGVLRTPPSSLTDVVPLRGEWCRVSPEHFTIMADVYRILGAITEDDYTVATPDGRGRSRDEALARLARLVCADLSSIETAAVETIAGFLEERQIERVAMAIRQVLSRLPRAAPPVAVTAGAGAFLAAKAARRAGLEVIGLAGLIPGIAGDGWTRAAPAAAIAVLLADENGAFRFTL